MCGWVVCVCWRARARACACVCVCVCVCVLRAACLVLAPLTQRRLCRYALSPLSSLYVEPPENAGALVSLHVDAETRSGLLVTQKGLVHVQMPE